MSIETKNLGKRFGSTVALDRFDLTVNDGEFLALLGPSGSGKTTLLRIIAGLEKADRGTLTIHGRDALHLPPRERRIGFVFQHYALFRHMTVADNIAYGLRIRPRRQRPSRAATKRRVEELLSLMQLPGLGNRYPSELSGGQRQRVALARALAVDPKVMLLDEPFGALDARVRVDLRHWLRGLHDRLGLTSVFVTHDQEEALELADRVVILNTGRIEQVGRPREVYDHPNSAFVMRFLGEVNQLECQVRGGVAHVADEVLDHKADGIPDGPAWAFVRPHEIAVEPAERCGGRAAVVRNLSIIGPRTRIHLEHRNNIIEVDADRTLVDSLDLAPGSAVGVRFTTLRFFPIEN